MVHDDLFENASVTPPLPLAAKGICCFSAGVKALWTVVPVLLGMAAIYLLSFPLVYVAATRLPAMTAPSYLPQVAVLYEPAAGLCLISPPYRAYCRWCMEMLDWSPSH
jgi:hypothetical protein